MKPLNRSTLKSKKGPSLTGLVVTFILACTFLVSFLGAVAWFDTQASDSEQGRRPLSTFLEALFLMGDEGPPTTKRASEEIAADAPEPQKDRHTRSRPSGEPFAADIPAPIDIVDAKTFVADGLIYRIEGIRTPSRDAICFDEDDRLWACGLQARAAFNNLTRETGLACEGTRFIDLDIVVVDCQAGDDDLATALVMAGFAAPDSEPDHSVVQRVAINDGASIEGASRPPLAEPTGMEKALRSALEENKGMWNGGWRVRE